MAPQSDPEILYSMYGMWRNRRSASGSTGNLFRFPWGEFQYVSFGQARVQFEEIFLRRQYAFRTQASCPIIVDCGGNVGLSAIWFKRNYPTCQLTVYEADPLLAKIAGENLRRADCNDVVVRNEAVWIENKAMAFRATGDDKGKIDAQGSVMVTAIDIAERLPQRVDLLKLDIEGAEYAVLERMCQTGAIRSVRSLVCEFHVWRDRTSDLLDILTQLTRSGMKLSMTATLTPWLGRADENAPFEVVNENEVLMEVYGWRGGEWH